MWGGFSNPLAPRVREPSLTRMRGLAILAFVGGLILYPVSLALTVNALEGEVADARWSPQLWFAGRSLAVVTVLMFGFSVVAAFFTTERARRVVPALSHRQWSPRRCRLGSRFVLAQK